MSEKLGLRSSLRMFGESLDPDEVTKLLGSSPSHSYKKGAYRLTRTGKEVVHKHGMWLLDTNAGQRSHINQHVAEILSQLANDLSVWQLLTERYNVEIFCGFFMESDIEALIISPATMLALGQRNIELAFHIYESDAEDDEVDLQAPIAPQTTA